VSDANLKGISEKTPYQFMLLDESGGPCDVRWSTLIRMEYTDAPTEPQPFSADMMQCPYCGTMLPSNAEACRNCDWTREATKPAEPKASDAMAILLSIIPGLGHIYKGHRIMGAIILFLITPTAIAFAILASIASAGWGILMLIPYWGAVMLHVWAIEDRVTPTPDEGEQY
jgi:TM2 domain-containing membrane protein YozV